MTPNQQVKPPFKDRIIPWYFVMFFAVIFVVNMMMFHLASKTHTGVVDHKAYQRGLAYNDVIERGDHQRQLGWQAKVDFNTENNKVSLSLKNKDAQDILGAHIIAYAFRPTQDGHDFKQELTETLTAGQYEAELSFPLKGQWELRFDIEKNGDRFYISKKITVEE